MANKNKLFFAVALLSILSGCQSSMIPYIGGNPENTRRVLILSKTTQFKRAVIDSIISTADREIWYFRVNDAERSGEENLQEYDTVLVIGRVEGGCLDPVTQELLNSFGTGSNVILLVTQGFNVDLPECAKASITVDSVTAPSRKRNVMNTAGRLFSLLEKKF